MTKKVSFKISLMTMLFLSLSINVFAQRRGKTIATAKPKPIVFAVLNDGTTLEPIGVLDKGELVAAESGEGKVLQRFVTTYYKPNAKYNLIFGGASNGTVTVKSSNPQAECAKNMATATTVSAKAKIKGLVMGLATNEKVVKKNGAMRRPPTVDERTEIAALVRAEFTKQKVSAAALKDLHYYNSTALDVDNDGRAEIVGTYWVESSPKERNLLFFIAEMDASGKFKFGYSEYARVTPDELMSGDMKDLDELGGELLLDAMAYDGDETDEIFTIQKAFEGNNFHVYSRRDGKWQRVYEGYNYHCAY